MKTLLSEVQYGRVNLCSSHTQSEARLMASPEHFCMSLIHKWKESLPVCPDSNPPSPPPASPHPVPAEGTRLYHRWTGGGLRFGTAWRPLGGRTPALITRSTTLSTPCSSLQSLGLTPAPQYMCCGCSPTPDQRHLSETLSQVKFSHLPAL